MKNDNRGNNKLSQIGQAIFLQLPQRRTLAQDSQRPNHNNAITATRKRGLFPLKKNKQSNDINEK